MPQYAPDMGTTFEQFRAVLLNPTARRSVGIDMSDEQARIVAADETLARANYDYWLRTYRPGSPAPGAGVVRAPQAAVPPPPGWYPGPAGNAQWWDGTRWVAGAYAPNPMRPQKDVGIAYLLAILLGGFAAHRFYVGRIGSAIAFICLWWIGWLTTGAIVGIFMVLAAGIWWIIDLFLLAGMVREANGRRP